jgi:enterochelin esterase-like enzyme
MQAQRTLISPRITSLQDALTSGDATALEAFWRAISEQGAPLIEAIEGDVTHHLVTFLWRSRAETHAVTIWGGPAGLDHPENNQMTRLLDTDLWYKTYRVQADLRGVYSFSVDDTVTTTGDERADGGLSFLIDPLNPKLSHEDAKADVILSLLELPDAPPQSWCVSHPEVKKGQLKLHHLQSQILDAQRRFWVYTPADYQPSADPYGLLLVFDGSRYISLGKLPTILDNLVDAGQIAPLVAVLLDHSYWEERNHELACHQLFVDFLTQELMSWVHEHYHVTTNPAQTIVAGSSLGGLAAAFVGLRAPETFGNVLSQSGSFFWDKHPEEDFGQEWIIQQFIACPCLPLHFSFEAGLKEEWGWMPMVSANRHLRDVLVLKGYEVDYAEFNGYHHFVSWRGSFADRLMALVSKRLGI